MATEFESHIKVGDRVETHENRRGTCRYVGYVPDLGNGLYIGVEFDEAIDDGHDGNGYFECTPGYGAFIVIEHCKATPNETPSVSTNSSINAFSAYHDDPYGMNTNTSINRRELQMDDAVKTLDRQFRRRKSQVEVEQMGVVPPNYFSTPFSAMQSVQIGHEAASSNLEDWLPSRPNPTDLEQRNIVPANYWHDPAAVTEGKRVVKKMVAENLESFHGRRPTLTDLQTQNILPTEDDLARREQAKSELNSRLTHSKRPTITDLGDMHIIPHDYLDNLLEDAVAQHTRKQSRMAHVQDRLGKHLPEPVAQTLAETLVTSVQSDEDNDDARQIGHAANALERVPATTAANGGMGDFGGDEDEWQISFVYEPMQSFVPMNPAQKDEVSHKLERRLSLRPSQQQIEVWGFVPPQYFDSPEESFLRQALGREVAMDLLDTFLPSRPEAEKLTSRGITHPEYVQLDFVEAERRAHARKQSVSDILNTKLDPTKRPSISEIGQQGLIPDNWLMDLYGLADQVRKRHGRMESAVADLKSKLNVPPILADVVARDVLDEIETVDPYLQPEGTSEMALSQNNMQQGSQGGAQRRSSWDRELTELQNHDAERERLRAQERELERQREREREHAAVVANYEEEIRSLKATQSEQSRRVSDLEAQIRRMKDEENKHLQAISTLERKTSVLDEQSAEISVLREQQNEQELHRLDSEAVQLELEKERLNTRKLEEAAHEAEEELLREKDKVDRLEAAVAQAQRDKIELIERTHEQMETLRQYLRDYQRYFERMQQKSQSGGGGGQRPSALGFLFG